jgi:hypothetical protein
LGAGEQVWYAYNTKASKQNWLGKHTALLSSSSTFSQVFFLCVSCKHQGLNKEREPLFFCVHKHQCLFEISRFFSAVSNSCVVLFQTLDRRAAAGASVKTPAKALHGS